MTGPAAVGRDGRTLAPLGTAAAFAVAVVVLLVAGRGPLAAPPLEDLGGWAEARGPVVASVAVLRLLALVAAGWMFVATAVGGVAEVLGAARLAGAARRAVPPALRRALTGLAGAGAAGAAVLGASGGASPGAASTPPAAEAPAGVPGEASPPSALERLVRLPDPPADPPPVETMAVLGDAAGPGPVPSAGATWVVGPGDSFWSIAEELLAEELGRPPSDGEVDPAWRRLVEANRDRLVTGDPDLLLPGQELVLPAPAAGS